MLKPLKKLKQKIGALLFGRESEKLAASQLKERGYKIIEMNYRCRAGEIDIIARQGEMLVFCEVKARRSRSFGSALEGITESKRKKIRKTADHYMFKKGIKNVECRFDVVAIEEKETGTSVEVITNAF